MTGYIIRRIVYLIPILVMVTAFLFWLMRMTPGDPVRNEFGLEVEEETVQARRKELGQDRPIIVQYVDWVGRMFTGDFGRSIRARRPVIEFRFQPWLVAGPGLAVFISVLSFFMIGDALRDALDPRLRGKKAVA